MPPSSTPNSSFPRGYYYLTLSCFSSEAHLAKLRTILKVCQRNRWSGWGWTVFISLPPHVFSHRYIDYLITMRFENFGLLHKVQDTEVGVLCGYAWMCGRARGHATPPPPPVGVSLSVPWTEAAACHSPAFSKTMLNCCAGVSGMGWQATRSLPSCHPSPRNVAF